MWLEEASAHRYCNAALEAVHWCRRRGPTPKPAAKTAPTPRLAARSGASIGFAPMYRAVTRSIEVVVTPRFIADGSSPEDNYFFWAYTIAITNHGAETVQLKTRHWRITDANGRRQEVRGAGVVGEEPVLKAGESFEYTSGVPLQTPSGFVAGVYGMVSASGENFEIEIPAFSLDSGNSKRTIN
jgi:ApaG protein